MTSNVDALPTPNQSVNRIEALGPRFTGAIGVLALEEAYDLESRTWREARRMAYDGLHADRLDADEVRTFSEYIGQSFQGAAEERGIDPKRREVAAARIRAVEWLANYSLLQKDKTTARSAARTLLTRHGIRGVISAVQVWRESFRYDI